MLVIHEIAHGGLNERRLEGNPEFDLRDVSHLLVYPVSDDYLCVTNTFRNRSFLISKEDWNPGGIYPADFEDYAGYPDKPCTETDLPAGSLERFRQSVAFVIVLSYDCNLRCKYCYQQCNPNLDRSRMTDENLAKVLDTIEQYQMNHPEMEIGLELFGGEPLLKENYEDVIRVFDFAADHGMTVSITTNGVNLPMYLKDLVIYSGLQMNIATTIDSITENEKTRFSSRKDVDASGNSLLHSIYTLINNDVYVSVGMNIDRHNIDQVENMLAFYRDNGFLGNPYFSIQIARVDDRLYETGYDQMMTDTELIERLSRMDIPVSQVNYAFVKSTLFLCRKLDPAFRQMEARQVSNYCWASSPVQQVFYVDAQLDVFRCTYTVGRKEYSLFKFSLENLEKYQLPDRTYMDYERCRSCPIGGYCSGGCALSAGKNFDRMCEEEKKDFHLYLRRVYYPRVQSMLEAYLRGNMTEQKELVS